MRRRTVRLGLGAAFAIEPMKSGGFGVDITTAGEPEWREEVGFVLTRKQAVQIIKVLADALADA